jgi:hypothetical protein
MWEASKQKLLTYFIAVDASGLFFSRWEMDDSESKGIGKIWAAVVEMPMKQASLRSLCMKKRKRERKREKERKKDGERKKERQRERKRKRDRGGERIN